MNAIAAAERYRQKVATNHSFSLVPLSEPGLFRIEGGGIPKSNIAEFWGGGIPWATLVDLPATDFITEVSRTERTISHRGPKESSAKMIPV